MLLQVFLKVKGLPTGRLWAGEGLLVDVLVLLVVLGEEAHGFLRATTRADPAGRLFCPLPQQFSLSLPAHIILASPYLYMSTPIPSLPDPKLCPHPILPSTSIISPLCHNLTLQCPGP